MYNNAFYYVSRALQFEHGLILEQEERIKRIEGDILDVNQVMRELGSLVYQQADSISMDLLYKILKDKW